MAFEAGATYIMNDVNEYVFVIDDNHYLLDSFPLPDDWLENKTFPIQRTTQDQKIKRRPSPKQLGGRARQPSVSRRGGSKRIGNK